MSTELHEILNGLKRTLSLLETSEKRLLVVATLCMLIAGILTNLPALILGQLVDRVVQGSQFQFSSTIPYLGLIILIILIRETLTVIRKYVVHTITTQTEKKQTVHVIEHLLKSDLGTLHSQQIGSLHGRVLRSIQGLIEMIKLGFQDFFPVLFSALAAISIALYQKPLLASVMILVIPAGIYIIVRQISSQKGVRVSLLRGKERIDGTVVEMLGGIETIRVANTTHLEVKRIETIAEQLRSKEIKHHLHMALFDSAKYLNEGFFYILVISLAILFSAQGIISKGDVLVYSILFLSITNPLREIHRILDHAHEGSIRVNDLYELLNQPEDRSFAVSPATADTTVDDTILSVRNLAFKYPGKEVVLKGINLTIQQGEKIGIAGASGCGKSTFIKIILKLIHGYSGQITLLGKDLSTITREEIAQKIAYVPQRTYIFTGTIRENITYGLPHRVSDEEVMTAAKKAHIYDEIMKDLGGLDGKVTENGNNLSGGQRQRLAIARLILKSPEIFIFDEATSALDNTNESLIQKNIEEIFKDKTTITIAHRLTTLKNSDRILVFDKGSIVQQGSFKELSQIQGLFKEFLEQTDHSK